jgi:hypothetical protein
MHSRRFLVIPCLLLFMLACNMISRAQSIQNAVSTQLPSLLTNVPTVQGMLETIASQSTSACPGTSTTGGLGLSLDHAKAVLQATQQFTFTDSTVTGQPASTATLSAGGASTFSAISSGFSAQFIGDPCNLSRILVTAPYTDQPETVTQGLTVTNSLFTTLLPLDVQLPLLAWLATTYSNVPVSGQQQTTIKNMQFTLSRTSAEMNLEVVPAK